MRWRIIVRRIAFEGASNLVVGRGEINESLTMAEAMRIAPFATPTGYEIVYSSLQTSGFILLDRIPRPDIGCLPCIGSLTSLVSTYSKKV